VASLTAARAKDAASDSGAGSEPQLRSRVLELEHDLEETRRHAQSLGNALSDARRQLDEAVQRLREEAEARDRAEARSTGPEPQIVATAADPEAPQDEPDARGLHARVEALEPEAATARDEADRLATLLLVAGRQLQDAADRLRDETEARMRAEARAEGAATESHA
jgi:hypothetical protein